MFIINLACSYPLTIYPTNTILEGYLFKGDVKKDKMKRKVRKWLKNLSRAIVAGTSVYFAIVLADKLDKFLSLLGALLCAPLVFTLPSLCHY